MPINKIPSAYILTADIGGAHITSAICDLEFNIVVPQSLTRIEVFSKESSDNIFSAWNRAFQYSIKNSPGPISGLGIAMPGPFDYENGICYIKGLNKYENLYGLNIREYLAKALDLDPARIRFRNDAEAAIAGEALAGAGQKYDNVVGITLGTGFGSAHYKQNITRDINLGSDKYKDSIADDHLSTRWFLKRYCELTGINMPGVKELAILAENDKNARQVFDEFAFNLYEFINEKLPPFSPRALIICGNIAKAHRFFVPYLEKMLHPVQVKLAQLDESAALLGAASLFEVSNIFLINNAIK